MPQLDRKVSLIARNGDFGLRQTVAIPLVVGGNLAGLIYIFRGYSDVFSANDRQLLQSFADQAAIAVHNAQFYRQTLREKQRLDAIIEASADGVLILDSAQRITVFNRALARISGLHASLAIRLRHVDVIAIDAKRAGLTLSEASAGGWPLRDNSSFFVEGDLRRHDGAHPPVIITYAALGPAR